MDYSIGSIADLVSGSNTPNKPKVVQKEFKKSITKSNKKSDVSDVVASPKGPKRKHKDSFGGDNPNHTAKKTKRNQTPSSENDDSQLTGLPKKGPVQVKPKKSKKIKHSDSISENDAQDEPQFSQTEAHKDKSKKKKKTEPDASTEVKQSVNERNAERRVKKKAAKPKIEEDPERRERTVFVGNVPIMTRKSDLKKFFAKYGSLEAVRFRGVPVKDERTPKKVAVIKQEFHPNRTSCIAYVRYQTKEEAENALQASGELLGDHHIRVRKCVLKENVDENKAIFIGNLCFDAEDDQLWKLFEPCGEIDYVRIIRDPRTGVGKGFGYVNFKSADSVQLALEMGEIQLKNRVLRISVCKKSQSKKKKKGQKGNKAPMKKTHGDSIFEMPQSQSFQGTQLRDKKKKNKLNKGALQKKKIMKKVVPRPK